MHGASFIEHNGRQVILLDFKGLKGVDVAMPIIAQAGEFVQSTPADGASLTCTDVRDTKYDRQIVDAFKQMTKANRPHVKAAAVVSDSPLHRAAISMIALFSRRKIEVFDSRERALDWLIAQP